MCIPGADLGKDEFSSLGLCLKIHIKLLIFYLNTRAYNTPHSTVYNRFITE